MSEEEEHTCIDMFANDAEFDPDGVGPALEAAAKGDPKELGVAWRKQWQNGQELRIRFLDGSPELQERVKAHANKWLQYANLSFNWGNHAQSDIRVTFTKRGYWSYVGTDANHQPTNAPTLNLGGFTKDTDDTRMQRVVLHEFGHAIGCIHEQSSPVVDIPWDNAKVYAYYAGPPNNWSQAKVDHNVLKRYTKKVVKSTQFHDPTSIMQYPVLNRLLKDGPPSGYHIGWNNELSEHDKAFVAKMYPKDAC